MNNQIGKNVCNWAWVNNNTAPSGAYFQYDWPQPVTIGSFYVETERIWIFLVPFACLAIYLSLTESGLHAITTAFQAHNEREQEWAGSLSADEQRTLIALLEKLTTHSLHFEVKQRM